MNTQNITFHMDMSRVNWEEMKKTLQEDNFDNGRSAEQLKGSFENSYAACVFYAGTANTQTCPLVTFEFALLGREGGYRSS